MILVVKKMENFKLSTLKDADVANVLRRVDVNKALKAPLFDALRKTTDEVSNRFTIPEVIRNSNKYIYRHL
jgi:hypothetical protein